MFFGVMAMGALLVIIVIFFLVSGYYRLKRRARGGFQGDPNKSYTSTGQSYQRYYGDSDDGGSKFRSNRYSGPSAKRSQKSSSGSASGSGNAANQQNDVIEVPLLEVVDVPDTDAK